MCFHTRQVVDPRQKAIAAHEAVDFVMPAMPAPSFGRELLEREMAGADGQDFFLLTLFARAMLAIHPVRWDFCPEVSARPRASLLARRLAAAGAPVVNAAPGTFYLPSELLRRLVTLLDGTHNPDDLLDDLAGQTPAQERRELRLPALQRRLQRLADNALLVGWTTLRQRALATPTASVRDARRYGFHHGAGR